MKRPTDWPRQANYPLSPLAVQERSHGGSVACPEYSPIFGITQTEHGTRLPIPFSGVKKKGNVTTSLQSAKNTFATNLKNEMVDRYGSVDEAITALVKDKIAGRSTLYRLINADTPAYPWPKLNTLVSIANGLGISIVQLVGNARDIRLQLIRGSEAHESDRAADNVRDLKRN